MLFSLILSIRVFEKGISAYIPFVTGENLTSFISTNKSVVFFTNDETSISYADFGIYKYKDVFKFARSTIADGEKYNFKQESVAAFKDGKLIRIPYNGKLTGVCLRWLSFIDHEGNYWIRTPEELRQTMKRLPNTLFAVNLQKTPETFADEQIFHVNSSLFEHFHIDVGTGIYLFRSCDKQLFQLDDNGAETLSKYEKLSQCPFDNINEIEMTNKPYLAAYISDDKDDDFNQRQFEVLKELKGVFGEKCFFVSFVQNSHGNAIKALGKLTKAKPPMFVVFNTSEISAGRWILNGYTEELLNIDYVSKFLNRVFSGQEEYGLVSKPMDLLDTHGPLIEITASQFDEYVIQHKDSVLVAFTVSWCGHCKKIKPLLNETAALLNNTNKKVYFFDCESNDMPPSVPSFDGYPTLYFWPKKGKAPIEFTGNRTVESFIQIFKNYSKKSFTIPKIKGSSA